MVQLNYFENLNQTTVDLENCVMRRSTPPAVDKTITSLLLIHNTTLTDYLLSDKAKPVSGDDAVVSMRLGNFETKAASTSGQAPLCLLKNLLTNVFLPMTKNLNITIDNIFCLEEMFELLTLEEDAVDLGFVDRFDDRIADLKSVTNEPSHKEKIEETVDFFKCQKASLDSRNSRTASHTTPSYLDNNIQDYLSGIISLVKQQQQQENGGQSSIDLTNTLMFKVNQLLLEFLRREVHCLRSLVTLMGNTNLNYTRLNYTSSRLTTSVAISSPKMKAQPVRLFSFIYLAKMWPGVEILKSNYQIENVTSLIDQANLDNNPGSMSTNQHTNKIAKLSNALFGEHNLLDKNNYRLQLLQSIRELFMSLSGGFAKQTLEVIMNLHSSCEMYMSCLLE